MMWKEKYRIGVKEIDEQHQELFRRVSNFIETVQGKGSWEERMEKVKETMEFMKEYVVFHFEDEEKCQLEIGYPLVDAHKQEHIKFKEEVGKYIELFQKRGYSEELVQEFGGKLMTWLILHVAVSDQKIGDYVKSQESDR